MRHRKLLLLFGCILALITLVRSVAPTRADEEPVIEIYKESEFLTAIQEHPDGNLQLLTDIDFSNLPQPWPSPDFSGTLDGNGHCLINLGSCVPSAVTQTTYDGNRKTYDTSFIGLFGNLNNATVRNLRLIGVNISETLETDAFIGGIAGYANNSVIENCEVTGSVRLDVTGKMFGVGGVIGYGNAVVRNCNVDVTLINIDNDASTRDEQFLGAICAAGYPDIEYCTVKLAGFISDHGYVHSGGLVGMYIVYPKRYSRDGFVRGNVLEGFITFFEDNTNRRAYCVKDFGEVMDREFKTSGNDYDFKRDERKEYKVNLLPHGDCKTPKMNDEVIQGTCNVPGYTKHVCETCGYTYKDSYTLVAHTPAETATVITAPTLDNSGLSESTCTVCGTRIVFDVAPLTPTPTLMPTPTMSPVTETPSASTPGTNSDNQIAEPDSSTPLWKPLLLAILTGSAAAVILSLLRHRR